jgi:GAF domain-containing protein
VAGTGEPRIAVDVGVDSVFLNNPLLAETRSELALSLRVGEWVIGVLDVQSQKANAFDDEDITILQLMADQLAVAIESARLLSKTQERVQELTGLHEIAQAFSTMTDVAETYGTLAERLARLVGATSCIVALYDEETGLISAQAPGFGVNDEMLAAAHYPARSVRDLWNFRKQGTFRANKKVEIPDFFDSYLHNFRIESVVAVPMLVEGRLVGLVFVANKAGGFSEDDARLLGVFASQAGIVIENARLFERTSRQLDELSALHGISTAAAEASNETELIQQSFSLIGDRLFPDNFGVLLVDETGQALVVQTSHRIGKSVELQKIPLGQGITGKVAQDGRSRRINDVRNDPDYIVGNDRTRSELCVPIKIKERIIGVINAESERLNAFSPNDERFLATLADQLATGIEKIRLFKQTQKQPESL